MSVTFLTDKDKALIDGEIAKLSEDMVKNAFVNHASETDEYGMATADLFGHVKAAWVDKLLQKGREDKGQDPTLIYDGDGNLIGDAEAAEEYLRGIVPSMWMLTVYSFVLTAELEDLEYLLDVSDERVNQLRNRVIALESEIAALKGA